MTEEVIDEVRVTCRNCGYIGDHKSFSLDESSFGTVSDCTPSATVNSVPIPAEYTTEQYNWYLKLYSK